MNEQRESAFETRTAEQALTLLAQLRCEYTDQLIDLADGHCISANGGVDQTHTHCPYCGSRDECPHLLAQWGDDDGYSGPDIPLPPEDWNVKTDWTQQDLRQALGDLLPTFNHYADLADMYEGYVQLEVFQEFLRRVGGDVRMVSWCGDGMAAGVGEVYYAADALAVTTKLSVLTRRLDAAIAGLEALRTSTAVVPAKVDA